MYPKQRDRKSATTDWAHHVGSLSGMITEMVMTLLTTWRYINPMTWHNKSPRMSSDTENLATPYSNYSSPSWLSMTSSKALTISVRCRSSWCHVDVNTADDRLFGDIIICVWPTFIVPNDVFQIQHNKTTRHALIEQAWSAMHWSNRSTPEEPCTSEYRLKS